MGSLGLESVLVGDVVDGVLLSVSSDELVGSADLQGGVLQTDLLQLGRLSAGHTIAGLVPEESKEFHELTTGSVGQYP